MPQGGGAGKKGLSVDLLVVCCHHFSKTTLVHASHTENWQKLNQGRPGYKGVYNGQGWEIGNTGDKPQEFVPGTSEVIKRGARKLGWAIQSSQ